MVAVDIGAFGYLGRMAPVAGGADYPRGKHWIARARSAVSSNKVVVVGRLVVVSEKVAGIIGSRLVETVVPAEVRLPLG